MKNAKHWVLQVLVDTRWGTRGAAAKALNVSDSFVSQVLNGATAGLYPMIEKVESHLEIPGFVQRVAAECEKIESRAALAELLATSNANTLAFMASQTQNVLKNAA